MEKMVRLRKRILCFSLFLLLGVTVFFLAGKNLMAMVFNLFFLLIMTVMIFAAEYKGMAVLQQAAEDSGQIRQRIDELSASYQGEELWEELSLEAGSEAAPAFSDPVLERGWEHFIDGGGKKDLSDALDEELVLERGKKGYCEMVPGFLTALGILGTFIGLVMSMDTFSFDSAEQIEATMESIVSGIQVAFYTSIYGVTLSVIYNILYRAQVQQTCDEIYELQQTVSRNRPNADGTFVREQGTKLQQEEIDVLRRIENALGKGMGTEIANALNGQLTPVFQSIDTTLKRVIGDFRAEQSESLSYIVEEFVKQMRQSLDSHINTLGESVERLSLSQEAMTEKLSFLLDEIGRTAADTRDINAESERILEHFDIYMRQLNDMQTHVSSTFQLVESYTTQMYQSMQVQKRMIDTMQAHEQEIMKSCSGLQQVQQNFSELTKENISAVRAMTQYQEEFQKILSEVLEETRRYEQNIFQVFTELKQEQLAATQRYQKTANMLLEQSQTEKRQEKKEENNSIQSVEMQSETNELLRQLIGMIQEEREMTFLQKCRRSVSWRKKDPEDREDELE